MFSEAPYSVREMGELVELLERNGVISAGRGTRMVATAFAAEKASGADIPDDIADVVKSAFVAGLDKAREIKEGYDEWPTLPGRVELAQDYVDTLTLLGPADLPFPDATTPDPDAENDPSLRDLETVCAWCGMAHHHEGTKRNCGCQRHIDGSIHSSACNAAVSVAEHQDV